MFKFNFLLVLAGILFLSSCGSNGAVDESSSSKFIPESASMAGVVNIGQMMNKADYASMQELDFFKDMIAEAQEETPELVPVLKDLKLSGINIDGDMSFFATIDDDGNPDKFGFVIGLSDASKWNDISSKMAEKNEVKVESADGISFVKTKSDAAMIWSDSKLIVVVSQNSDPVTYAKEVMANNSSLLSNEKFKKNVASNKDFVFWMSTDDFANVKDIQRSMKSVASFGVPADLFEGNDFVFSASAEKGMIDLNMDVEMNKWIQDNFGSILMGKFSFDAENYLPAGEPNSIFTMALNPTAVYEFAKSKGLTMFSDRQLSKMETTTKDLVEAISLEVAVANYLMDGEPVTVAAM